MNHILIALSLFPLCTQQITFSMENHGYQRVDFKIEDYWDKEFTEQITNQSPTNSLDEFVDEFINEVRNNLDEVVNNISNNIDTEINTLYPTNNYFIFTIQQLPKNKLFDIINLGDYPEEPDLSIFIPLILKLTEKNKYFAQAFNYFYDLARKNRDSVTVDTLETIQNPTLPQPIPQLNELS